MRLPWPKGSSSVDDLSRDLHVEHAPRRGAHVDYLRSQRVPENVIEQWFARLFELVDSLSEWPERFPVDEIADAAASPPSRKATFAQFIIQYRVDHQARQVVVLGMVHAGRRRGG